MGHQMITKDLARSDFFTEKVCDILVRVKYIRTALSVHSILIFQYVLIRLCLLVNVR